MGEKIIDQELEDAANDYITGEEKQSFALTPILRVVKHAFKAGAAWHEEQSATDAVEMLQWLVEQDNAVLLYEGLIQHKASAKELSKQLYKLWQKSKNNANK